MIDRRECTINLGGALLVVAILVAAVAGPAAAQADRKNPPVGGDVARDSPPVAADAPSSVPGLDLSQSQRETVHQSISNRQAKKDTAPVGFRAVVGAQVPQSIELEPLPKTIIELVPKIADYQYAFVANQVLIVDPRSRTVVDVIH
jgi:Protein of unknown function (DUF1236)